MSEAFGGFGAESQGEAADHSANEAAADVHALQERLREEFGANADSVLREFVASGRIPDDASREIVAEMSHLGSTYGPEEIEDALGDDRMVA